MHVISPQDADVLTLQKKDGAFYFSKAFSAILHKNGFIATDGTSKTGPGLVTRGFAALEELESDGSYLFEGPFSDELIEQAGLDVEMMECEECFLADEQGATFSKLCYKTITTRTIPPFRFGSRANPTIEPHYPEDTRWRRETMQFHVFKNIEGAEPILHCELPDGTKHIVGIRKANRIFIGISLLDVLVQQHVCPPIYGTSWYGSENCITPFYPEKWLFGVLSQLAFETGKPYLRANIWPAGYTASFCIRHDFDRVMAAGDMEDLLEFYDRTGVCATVFWRICRADDPELDIVRNSRHEVALHTEVSGEKAFDKKEMAYFANRHNLSMRGYSAHGGRGAAGYLGQRQFEWAIQNGMEYGELISVEVGSPFPGILVSDDLPEVTDLWIPGTHYSIDVGTKPEAYDLVGPREYADRRRENGEQIVIMNHPDIHLPQLKQFIEETDFTGVWRATLLEATRWCQQRTSLRASYTQNGDLLVKSPGILDHDVEIRVEGVNGDSEPVRLAAGFSEQIIKVGISADTLQTT